MRSRSLYSRWLVCLLAMIPGFCYSQFYTGYSRMAGGNQVEEVFDLQVINGEAYLLGTTRSTNFPSTNGSTYRGNLDMTLTKYSTNGTILYATYIGGLGNDFPTAMKIVNGDVYISLYTDSINFPVTNQSVFRGKRDVVVLKIGPTGNILFSTYIGGPGSDYPAFKALDVFNNKVVLAGTTSSPTFPVTTSIPYRGGASDAFSLILNSTDGSILSGSFWGGNNEDFLQGAVIDSSSIYLVGSTRSRDIPATIGSTIGDTLNNIFIARMNLNNLGLQYARYLGGSKNDQANQFTIYNNMLEICGFTASNDFQVTNGTLSTTLPNDLSDGFFTRLNTDGSIQYSTYLTTEERDNPTNIIHENDITYLGGTSISIDGKKFLSVYKILANGSLFYNRRFQIGMNTNNINPSFFANNGGLYMAGITQSGLYPVTNQSQFFNAGTGFISKLDAAGNLIFSSYLGSMTNLLPLQLNNGLLYLVGQTSTSNYPVTNGSVFSGGSDNILIIFNTDGSKIFSGYTGGSSDDIPRLIVIDGNRYYFSGKTISANYPSTINEPNKGSGDQYITMIQSCPAGYRLDIDSIRPAIQTACKTGIGELISGPDISVPGDSLPILYRAGVATYQPAIIASYQWQKAFSPGGPWTDIPGATFKNYLPEAGFSPTYYRRLSFSPDFCGRGLIHISDTAALLVNQLTAPVADGGGPFVTCPGYPVVIGGNPTASGGNPPYTSFVWDQGLANVANPTVISDQSALYTVIVTDQAGCKQIGQSAVLMYQADAGPDKGSCGSQPALIGTPLLPGVPGLQYNWIPSSSLNTPNIAQPQALPSVPTDYILTLTVPVTGGGSCQTTDTVRVTPVAAPVTPNFAGPDKIFCLQSSALLGTAPEQGFNYVWSPGSYINSNNASTTTYYAGNIVMPVPNPAVMQLTAQKNGCSFSDETIVTTIEARAGRDGCGPRLIGLPDRTPQVNETYSWTIVSGPGSFTGPTNLPQVPVTASVGGPTVYRLTVTYNGYTCTDDVTVPPGCTNCTTEIFVEAQYTCPSYSANGGNVTLVAFTSLQNATLTWSPQIGLTAYTGSVVQLTDNVPRVYTVTARDNDDSSIVCSDNIYVNDPSFVRPLFPAPDTVTCTGQPVAIGLPPVAGYTYEWTGTGLSGNLSSNPVATINVSTAFPVTVTDISGCILKDTVVVLVQNALVNAGPDRTLCSSGIVKLGTAGQPNTSYLWEPQASPWQNNTNQFSAQPEVLVATNTSFFVTATTSAGCIIRDTVNVNINPNPSIPDAPDTSVCLGSSVRIGSPAIQGVTYQWSPSTGLNNATSAQPTANPAVTTTYTVTATFPGICNALATDQVTVNVKSAFFSMPDISFCPDNGPVSLGVNAPSGMNSYLWQPQQAVTNAAIVNPSTQNPPPKVTTTFTLLVNNPNGCQYRDTIQLIPTVTAPQAGIDKLLCKGDSTYIGSAANTAGSGITYNWNPAQNLNDPLSPNPLFYANSGGTFTYILTKSDLASSCSSKDTVVITVQDISFPVSSNNLVCENACIQIGTTPVPGIFYQWSPASGLSNPGIANPLACVGNSGITYTLTASNLNGCSVSRTVYISVSPIPAPQVSVPNITGCAGDTTLQFNPVIQPPGNYQYTWSPNNGTLNNTQIPNPTIQVASPGIFSYQLQVTDTVSGCRTTATGLASASPCNPNASIGDYLWMDTNANGLQDPGEPGISGITVRLFNAAGFNLASTSTNPSGLYYFSNVPPAEGYYVVFSKPDGYVFTNQLVGGPGSDINSKANDSGRTNAFNVPPGANILNIDAGIKLCGGGGPVPVTLLNFSAAAFNKSVMLYWQTTAEYNNDHFDIQRSRDGLHFTSIGRMAGHGTTTIPQSYQWLDKKPFNGINYYRLRQTDIDGRSTLSRIIPVNFNNPTDIIAVYDPGSHSIQIHFNREQTEGYAVLFAPNGQRIAGIHISRNESDIILKLPVLATGIYTLLIDSDQVYYSRQILISR